MPIDVREVATTIVGSEVTSNCVRKNASRAALPAMNWAAMTPEQAMAASTAGPGRSRTGLISCGLVARRRP